MKRTKTASSSGSTFVEEVGFAYFPYWPLFVALLFFFTLVALLHLRYATPIYEATATLLIKDEKKGSEEGALSESLNFLNAKKIVENEVVVIQSHNLIDDVVSSLRLYAPVFEEGRISDRSAYESSPVMVTAYNLEKIEPQKKAPFSFNAKTKKVVIEGQSYDLDRSVVTPYGAVIFSANPHFVKGNNRPLYFSLLEPKKVGAGLLKKLEVTPAGKLSSIVKLKLKDEIPQRAEDILNALISKYNNASIGYKNDLAKNTIEFVEERMQIVQRELSAVEKKIQNYKTQQGIVDLSEQGRLYLQNVGENDQKLAQININMAVLDQVEKYVATKESRDGIVPSTLGVADPVLSGLLDKLYQAELERERLKKTTAENNPVMVAVEDEIGKVRPSILENIRNQRNALAASRRNLSMTNATYNSVLQTIPQQERELLDVSRQQSIKNGIYSFLLQKREETAIAFASNIADSRLVESARSSVGPVSPKKPIALLVALVFALIATIIYVAIKEKLNRNVLFRSEIDASTSMPVVAELSQFKNSRNWTSLVRSIDDPIKKQEFRHLRISADLLSKTSSKKKILVTSSISGEGKSFISYELAQSLSMAGKKVILVDMNIHKPDLSANFQIQEGIGMGDYLEKEAELYEIIRATEFRNFFVIGAGQSRNDFAELLLNGRIEPLLDYLEVNFDFIIFDSSPVDSATNAYILSPYCDLTLYVVRHAKTPKVFLKSLDETNAGKPLKQLSLVFNGVKHRGFIKNDFGYGYGNVLTCSSDKKKVSLKNLYTTLQPSFRKSAAKKV
jgi:capsular exopolysaccharide synthesis family protein